MRRGAFLGGLGAFYASAVQAQTPAPSLDRDGLLAQAERVEAHTAALGRLWPGYWPETQAFILYAPEAGAVFGGDRLPDAPRFKPGPLDGAEFHFVLDYPSGRPDTVLLRPDGPDDDLATLFHEQFHDFQTEAFRWTADGGHQEFVDLDQIPDLLGFVAAANLERLVLEAALRAPDPATRRDLARTYLALRTLRSSGVPATILTTERYREWSEGTAEFVGLQASALVAGHAKDDLPRAIARNLTAYDGKGENLNSALFRWRAYPVGAGLAWLLDDIGVADWRTTVADGAPLDVLLRLAIGEGSADDVREAATTFDLAALKAEAGRQLAEAPQAASDRAGFLAQAPRRLVVEIRAPLARAKEVQLSFSAPQMTPLADGGLILPQGMVVMQAPGLALKRENGAALIDFPQGQARQVVTYTVTLPTPNLNRPSVNEDGRFVVESDGLSLYVSRPVEVRHDGDETRVMVTLAQEP